MIKLIDNDVSHLVALKLSGELTKDDFDDVLPVIEQAAEMHGKISLFVDALEWEGVTLKALAKELTGGIPLGGAIKREAVVTDSKATSFWAEVGGKLWPGADVKSFDGDERDEALAWASESLAGR